MSLFGPPNIEKMERKNDIEGLIKALDYQKDGSIRKIAAATLGDLRDSRAVQPLIRTLNNDNWSWVREWAAKALGQIGDASAVESLLGALKHEDIDIRRAAAQALANIGDTRAVLPLVAILISQAEIERGSFESDILQEYRQNLVIIAGKNTEAFMSIIQLLNNSDHEVRKIAIHTLEEIGDKRAVEPLIAAFQDASKEPNRTKDNSEIDLIAEALGKIGDPRAVEPLIAAIYAAIEDPKREKDTFETYYLVNALGKIGDARAVEPIFATLEKRDARENIVKKALVQIGEAAVEPVINALSSKEESIRKTAARVLASIGGNRAVEPLIEALEDQSPLVRGSAANGLGTLGDARAVDPLIVALKDQDPDVRKSAAVGLGNLGDARAVDPLLEALNDESSDVRKCIADVLVEICGESREEPYLILLEYDKYTTSGYPDMDAAAIRKSAAEVLGRIGDAQAVGPLIKAIEDRVKDVRMIAAKSIVKIYNKQGLDEHSRKKILSSRNTIIKGHSDVCLKSECLYDSHTDSGIGVDFPL